jgi:hypothetical protein
MKKLVLLVVVLIVISSSLFAAGSLAVDKETQIMTYTYVTKEEINPQDFLSMKILKAKAIGEFSLTLQDVFDLEKVNFSRVEYSYKPGKVIMNFPFEIFYKLNLQ